MMPVVGSSTSDRDIEASRFARPSRWSWRCRGKARAGPGHLAPTPFRNKIAVELPSSFGIGVMQP